MRSYVITLKRTPLRLAQFQAAWNAPFPCEVHYGIDCEKMELPWGGGGWKLSEPGYCALNLTMVGLFSEALRQQWTEPFAVFQDDAFFAQGWHEYTALALREVPRDWLIVNLGAEVGEDGQALPSIFSEHLARMHRGWRAHALVYNPLRCAELIYEITASRRPDDIIWCDLMIAGWSSFLMTRKRLVGVRKGASVCRDKPDGFGDVDNIGQDAHPCLAPENS
jgi:hypothetical protein